MAEAFLTGKWSNFEELEDALTLQELKAIISVNRQTEARNNKFLAAIQGINLDDATEEDVEERFRKTQLRAAAKMSGKEENQMVMEELGFGYESS